MFSGIVETMAKVIAVQQDKENKHFTLECEFGNELKIDQSVAHNGVCLTVVKRDGNQYVVTAMDETLKRSNLGLLQPGDEVNVERSMQMNGRLDGHIVQGHVDTTATCTNIEDAEGSYIYTFEYEVSNEMIERGYFTVDKVQSQWMVLALPCAIPLATASKYASSPSPSNTPTSTTSK